MLILLRPLEVAPSHVSLQLMLQDWQGRAHAHDFHDESKPCEETDSSVDDSYVQVVESQGEEEDDEPHVSTNCGIHAISIMQATRPGRLGWRAILPLCMSTLLVAFQILALGALTIESVFRTCHTSDECFQGLWCAPTFVGGWQDLGFGLGIWFPPYTRDPGNCMDCVDAYDLNAIMHGQEINYSKNYFQPAQLRARAEAAGVAGVTSGVAHCNGTDTMPSRCDVFVSYRSEMTASSLCVLILTAIIMGTPTLEDFRELAAEKCLWRTRVDEAESFNANGLLLASMQAVCNFNIILRRYILPAYIDYAAISVICFSRLTAFNMLLNGVGISFISTVDNFLVPLFTTTAQRQELEEILSSTKEPQAKQMWLVRRIQTLCVIAPIPTCVVTLESLANIFEGCSTCECINDVLGWICYLVGFALLFIQTTLAPSTSRMLWRVTKFFLTVIMLVGSISIVTYIMLLLQWLRV